MFYRVTLSDIAKKAGVSKASASLALNGKPGVSAKLQQKIQLIATEMGYHKDPALSRIAACRWKSTEAPAGSVLGFLATANPLYPRIKPNPSQFSLYAAAAGHAAHLGYQIQFIDCSRYTEPKKLSDMLYHRGIQGLVIGNIYDQKFADEFEWDKFYSVAAFEGYVQVPVEQVSHSYTHALTKCWNMMRSYGMERIGLVLFQYKEKYFGNTMLCSLFEYLKQDIDPCNRLPTLFYETPEQTVQWVQDQKPEVLIGFNDTFYWRLLEQSVRFPEDVSFVSLMRNEDAPLHEQLAGISSSMLQMGIFAVDRVDSLIRQGGPHIPEYPISHRFMGPWKDGGSCKASL